MIKFWRFDAQRSDYSQQCVLFTSKLLRGQILNVVTTKKRNNNHGI